MKHLVAVLAFLIPSSAWAQTDEAIGLYGRYWWANASGDVETETRIDLDRDLDLDQPEPGFIDAGAWLKFGPLPLRLVASTLGGEFEGERTLDRDLTFEGFTYTAGTPVETELTLRTYTGMLDIGFDIGGGPVSFHFGIQIGARYYSHEFEISGGGESRRFDLEDVVFPLGGVRASLLLFDLVEIFAQFQGISTFDLFEDISGDFSDLVVELRVWLFGHLGIGGGYRWMSLDVERDDSTFDEELELDLEGAFAVLLLKF